MGGYNQQQQGFDGYGARGGGFNSSNKDNNPCNTLFIGNLSDNVDEDELRGLFNQYAGFKQLKVTRNPSNTVCFVEYQEVSQAAEVHASLQGTVLQTSDRGGIRIQYSKNPFGQRRGGGSYGGYGGGVGYGGGGSGYGGGTGGVSDHGAAPAGTSSEYAAASEFNNSV